MNTKFFIALRQASFKVLIAIVIVSMALTATSAQAAHTFGTTIRFTGNGNPLTQNYTIGATGTLLVVSIVTDGNAARTGGAPTYNGIALTQADVNRASGTETITELWYLVSPPTGAAYAISIPNTAPSRTLYVIASSYSAQAGFTSAFDVANGNTNAGSANPSVSVTTTANGDTIVAAMGNGNTAAPGARTGTNLFSVDNGSFSDNGQYSLQAAAGAIAMGWTVTTDDWGVVVAAFKEIPDTTITLVSDTNPSLAGQLVTFTATVTPAAATGTVTFYDGSTAIGSGALAGGVATFSTSALSSSSHNITAVYGGDATNGVSRSAVLVQVVNEVPVITSANTITFTLGQNNIFTATATGFPVPTWSAVAGLPAAVTFNTGTHVLSGIPAAGTVGSYPVTLSVTSAAGTDTQAFTLNVIKGPQTITFNALPAASYGGTFTINPVSNNGAGQPTGLTVAVAASGACSNVGNVISYNTLGTCTVVTSQVGNASYNAATPVTRTVQVNPAATNITITPSVNPSVLGQNVDFTVRVFSSGVPVTGGTVTITSCEWVVFFCAGGTNQTWGTYNLVGGVVVVSKADLPVERIGGNIVPSRITVTYNPTGNYNGSNTTLDQTVSTASTAVVLTSSINPSFFGQSVTFTATVTVSAPGAGSVSGGTVTFFDGATLLCTVANIPGNTAICTTATLVRGTHNITAHYQGTDQFGTSTSPILAQIVRRDSDIALISSLNPSVYGNTVTFTATVIDSSVPPVLPATTPTGTVSFYDDVTLLGTAALNGAGVATFNTSALIAGAHNITAVYNGDTFFVSGTSLIVIQTVTPATLTVTADNKSTIYGDNNVAFTVTYSGFVNAQTLATSDVTGAPACSTTATTASTVAGSPYPITCTIGSLNSNNYTFTFVDGNLAVTPKALTITADNQGKTYGFNLTFTGTEFTDSGLINADTITSVTLISAGAPAAAVNGSYPIVPSAAVGTGLGNYTITYVNGTLTVGGNLLIITANDFVGVNAKTYGQTLTFAGTEFTYFLAGGGVFLPGESLTSVTLSSLGTANNAPIGQYPIIPSNAVGTGLNNYVIIYRNGQLDVNQALLSFDPGNQTKTYGDTFTGYTGTFTGLMPFDNGVITPVYNSAGAPAIATVTAPGPVYPITVTFNDPNNRLLNYILTLDPVPAATLTVLPRTLTVTPTNRSKIYGDILTSADFAGTITGIQNSDNITATYDSPTGDPATAAIGGYPIVSTISDPGGMLGNYNLVAPDGTLTVTQRDLTITSNSQSKLYGENFTAFTGSVVGLQNGDVVTPTYDSVGAPATAAVGLYNITVLPLVGNTANYNLIYNIGTLSVLRQTLVFTPIDQTKIYGDTFTLFTGTITGLQNGDAITPNYSSPGAIATATVAGSPYPIVITLSDPTNKLNNYNYTINTGALTVTLRDLTVITDSKSKTYGTWFFAFTGSFTGIQNGDIITANYASAGSLPSAAVGVYPITATLNDPTGKLDNYNVTYNLGNLTVGSSVLTITADNKTITYGDPEPAFTFTYFGFAAGDTPAVVDTPPTCSVAGPHTDFGTYPIVCSGGVDNAYTFSYVAGTLTVNKRALVVTPTDKTKVFGDLFTAFTGTVTGVQAGDVITATYDSTGAPITAAVGNHPITTVLGDPGNRLGNYTVTINPATLTVTQRALTVTPADKTKIYGDVFTLFTGTITGIQNGDLITATYASPGAVTTATVAGSPYTITATLNAPAGVLANYNITLNTGSLTVTLRTLTVTPDNKGKVFGTLFTAFTGTVNGVQAGDNITATYASTGAPVNAAVGPYPITATLNDPNNRLANYTVVLNTGTLTVGNTVLTVTANNQSIVYGDPDPIFTFSYSGFTNGDTPAVLTTLPTCQVLPAHNATGTFPITCSGGIDDNYIFSYVPATLTVTSRALTVTPANQTKIYGAVFTAFTGATTGIQGADNITVTYNSAGAAAIATVGTYPITATLNDPNNRLGNYTITLNAGTMTVTQRPLVATSDDKAKAYGTLFTAFTGSIVGIQNGDNITATYTSVGAPIAAAAGAYPITIALNDPNNQLPNYTVTYNIGTLAVGGNVLIITPADKTKVYGDVFTAFTGTIVGLQAGDVITATYSSVGAAANAAVGNYDITATLNDPGNKLPNYTVILNTGTLSVTPRVLTVTPDNKAKVFGTLFTAFTGTVTGVQTGDNITASYASTGAPIAAATGTYPIITTLNDPNNRLANYTVTINAGTLTVGLSVLTVTANNQTLVYGTPDPVFTFNYAGFAPGDTAAVIDTPPTCQVLPAHNAIGTYPITCSGGVDNSYVFTYTAGTLTVTSRALTVTPDNKSKVYGDTFTAFTGTLTGLQASDNITAVYASTGAPAPATVGNYQITVPTINDPGNRLGNYTVTTNTGTLTVTQRPLTVTSADKIKFYGSLFTAFTGTITGIQNGDIITANYASAGGSVTAIVGDYPITITLNDPGTRLGNYTVTNNPGTLTVAPRDLVITPADKTKAFGSVFNTFTGTVIGIRNGDNITATYNSAGTPAIAPVGTYDINATLVDPANRLPNYDVSLNPGTLMVAVNAQTITIMIPAPASAGFNTGFTVAATASSGLPVVYSAGGTACTNVGATFTMTANTGVCIVQYDQPGDTNYPPAPQLTQTVSTQKASQTITVTTSAPVTALNGTSFSVAATSSSGLPVNIISNGNCSGNGSNTATITMATGTGLCTVIYGQAGNANYLAATSITEVVSITNAPIVTFNPQDVWVLPGATATFTAAAVGNPNPTVQWQVSADGGTTFTNIPGATSTTFSLPAQLVDNGLRYQAVFTNTEGTATTTTAVLHVDTLPPTVVKVNSVSDTGDGRLDEMETSTVAITQLLVTFNEDLGNPVGNTATNDVTNPANYLLVRDNGDGIQTALCSAGVTGGDIAVTVSQVSYSNNGGSGPYISTLALNGGAAIPNGTYRLITCGTTSITDVAGNKLAGDNATTGTDFTRNFIVAVTSGGGGGDGGNGNGKPQTSGGFLIPVTGFPQNHVTILPAQPANMTYAATDLWLEIPKLKLKMSIVGVPQTKTGWDISWLGSNAGWLNGSAFPTWKGNSVITAHVWDELNKPGPFVGLVNLQYGDQVKVHAFGNVYTYEVTSSSLISPSSTSKAFQHEDKSWLTLITCENYIEKTETYTHRRMVRALLVSVTKEK